VSEKIFHSLPTPPFLYDPVVTGAAKIAKRAGPAA
jgi:hypothetical protein